MSHWMILAGAILGAIAVVLGAFGAHALEARIAGSELEPAEQQRTLDNWEVAVRYQMYHGLALLVCGALGHSVRRPYWTAAGICFFAGTLIFSGCLYLYVITTARPWVAPVPVGGVILITGWVLLAWGSRPAGPSDRTQRD